MSSQVAQRKTNSKSLCSSGPLELFQKAVEVMCIVPKRCNDMMNVGRLQGFEVSAPAKFKINCSKL